MGLFGGDAHSSSNLHVEKPDILSIVAQAKPGEMSGCKWCKRVIFWNGAYWNHADGKHECPNQEHTLGPAFTVEVTERCDHLHFWISHCEVKVQETRYKCQTCSRDVATKTVYYGQECEGRVATPPGTHDESRGRSA